MSFYCRFALWISLIVSNQAEVLAKEPNYKVSEIPAWVSPVEADLTTPHMMGAINGGTYFRLIDIQADVETNTRFSHYAEEVITSAGLQSLGEIRVNYRPLFQDIYLHEVIIHRDGLVIDALSPELIRNYQFEPELSDGVFLGSAQLVLFLAQLRIGDVLEYSYSIRGENPALKGHFVDTFYLEWRDPVLESVYRLRVPKARNVNYRTFKFDLGPEETQQGSYTHFSWKQFETKPVVPEGRTPRWFDHFAWGQLSDFQSWEEVAKWGMKLYDFSHSKLSERDQNRLNHIKKTYPELDRQVIEVIRWVSDEIRYLAIMEGAAAYRPRDPSETLKCNFGDCKDKTVLLRSLLSELAVDSDPVYVYSEERGRVSELLPSPSAFDHVVLRINMPDGREIFCDPTLNSQGGSLASLFFPNYQRGLVLKNDTTDLIEIPFPTQRRGLVNVTEEYHLGLPGQQSSLNVVGEYFGYRADATRRDIASTVLEKLQQDYLEFYRDDFPDLTYSSPIQVEDNRSENRLVISESYDIGNPWSVPNEKGGWRSVYFYANSIRNSVRRLNSANRRSPMGLKFPEKNHPDNQDPSPQE